MLARSGGLLAGPHAPLSHSRGLASGEIESSWCPSHESCRARRSKCGGLAAAAAAAVADGSWPVFGQLPLPAAEPQSPYGFEGHPHGHRMPPLPPETPAISQMLAKEGTAWAALLSLHSSVVSAARSAASQSEENALLEFDERPSFLTPGKRPTSHRSHG